MERIKFDFVENKKNPDGVRILPYRATDGSIGYDFVSPIEVEIGVGESKLIWTDVKAKFPKKYALLIDVRSSMGNHRVMLANTIGVIDSDYYSNESTEGNIGINLYNYGQSPFKIKAGDRIAQGIFVKCAVGNDKPKNKRIGGFGSTNTK